MGYQSSMLSQPLTAWDSEEASTLGMLLHNCLFWDLAYSFEESDATYCQSQPTSWTLIHGFQGQKRPL